MADQVKAGARSISSGPIALLPVMVLSAVIIALTVHGPLRLNLRSEYFYIAQALVAGEGFAHPFGDLTGPTAWMPPVVPAILAAFLWLDQGSTNIPVAAVILLHVSALIGTAWFVLAVARKTTRMGTAVVAVVYLAGLLYHFRLCFQQTSLDTWLVLLGVNLLIAGLCWYRPLAGWQPAAGWGLFGGVAALINPVLGFTWGVMTVVLGFRERAWSRLLVALLAAGLTVTPWAVRNYLVFGRWIPIKSNLAYELYQSQCLQADGMLQRSTLAHHPMSALRPEGREYRVIGETSYLDRKWEHFWQAVRADPLDFGERVADRLLGVTVWYVPFRRDQEAGQPWVTWLRHLVHPLPFLALLFLLFTARRQPLLWVQWVVIGVYLIYLLPYVVASHYERYSLPLLGAKVLLVLWAADRLLSWRFRNREGFP